jgi:hypothetical protein
MALILTHNTQECWNPINFLLRANWLPGILRTLSPSDWRVRTRNTSSKGAQRPDAVVVRAFGRGIIGVAGGRGCFAARSASLRHSSATRPAALHVLHPVWRPLPDVRNDHLLGAFDAGRDFGVLSRECGRSDIGNVGDPRRPLVAYNGDPRTPHHAAAPRRADRLGRRRHSRRGVAAVGMPADRAFSSIMETVYCNILF